MVLDLLISFKISQHANLSVIYCPLAPPCENEAQLGQFIYWEIQPTTQ